MQPTTASHLLQDLYHANPAMRDTVAAAAAIPIDRAHAATEGLLRLTLMEQLRLAEAVLVIAPAHARRAMRLRSQVLAARSYELGEVEVHLETPADRWERSAALRR